MEKELREKIERLRIKARQFLDNKIKSFIKDINGNYYFCDILDLNELFLHIYNFAGKRKGEVDDISWSDILLIERYEEGPKND